MLTRRQLAFEIYAFFKIIDVQGQAKNMNDLLNVEMVNDNPMTISRSSIKPGKNPKWHWRRELKKIFWKAFTIASWRSRLSCKTPLEQYHPDRAGTSRLQNQNQKFTAQTQRLKALPLFEKKDRVIPVAPKNQGGGKRGDCNQRSSEGSCSRGANCAVKHKRERTSSPTKRQPTPKAEVSNQSGTSLPGKETRIATAGILLRVAVSWRIRKCTERSTSNHSSDL